MIIPQVIFRPPATFNSFISLFSVEVLRFFRNWRESFLPPAISMTLYFAIFGNLIGPRIGEMQGHSYVDFIAPGLVMLAVITGSYTNAANSFYFHKFVNSLDALLIAPLSNLTILLGFVLSSSVRGIIDGLVVLLLALFFTKLSVHNIWIIISMLFMTSFTFASLGLINGIFANSFDDIIVVPSFVITPLTYLGGIFFTIDLLPGVWHQLAQFNPMLYIVNAFRYGILGTSDISIVYAYGMIIAFAVAISFTCWYLIKNSVGIRS